MDIYRKVAEFCEPYFKDRDAIFTAASLTTAFIDHEAQQDWPAMPDDMRQGLYIGIQQIVRPLCRHAHKDDEDDAQSKLDLPEEDLLQDRYSIPCGRDERGEPVFKYIPRHRLNENDVKARCALDRRLSKHYARRADALESWFYRSRSLAG